MRLPLFFAKRYLFAKKSINAINVISAISVIGVLVSSAALVIVLSFYNGMENLILSLYSEFAPELRIEPTKGKTFDPNTDTLLKLRNNPAIKSYTEVLEDKVLIEYNDQQFIAQIKGLEPKSLLQTDHSDMLYAGSFLIKQDGVNYALIGAQVQANLRVRMDGSDNNIKLFSPRKGASGTSVNPMDDINARIISPIGVLHYQQGFTDLVITPLDFAKDLLSEFQNVSAIEMFTVDSTKVKGLQSQIQEALGDSFIVKNREQQNPLLYKTIRSEKWIVFFILTIIGIIAIFNIIGSLTMLVIDKKQDMAVLRSLGADNSLIQRIFFYEGVMIAFIGGIIGIGLGLAFCLGQEKYGFIRTGEGAGSVMDIYPVDIRTMDFILVFITVMIVAVGVSYIAAHLSVREIKNNSIRTAE
ncbi:MAG: FtsX-like permease family protein [Sphingobacterium sp.]|uniref:FtsX-like permease family protein n=1 Tax=Sphingobacterium sp. JB170 TaxID=1434842 RepID=UPI00097EF34C|nr:FtsX-like permease family protein [Sphingobacterium sp. JB170]SJN41946.1 Lipoprotein releasing system transmembrane protein LolC [Sphingobacterium sp. JB170]